jgi:hypothetical protein
MFLQDRPGEASRWDGREWLHVKVPFDTTKVNYWIADDRGHILVLTSAAPLHVFDVSTDGVTRFDSLAKMLVAAVARGARRFETGPDFQGCYVLDGKRIWLARHEDSRLQYFDGERWDEFAVESGVTGMYESPRYGVIIRTGFSRYHIYDRGQIVDLDYPEGSTRWLFGPNLFQPFEEELLKQHPELYTPAERDLTGVYHLLSRREGGGAVRAGEPEYVRGAELEPSRVHLYGRSLAGGYWATTLGLTRIFGEKIVGCDFRGTPVTSLDLWGILDDRSGNLWIRTRGTGGAEAVFCKRLDGFKLTLKEVPTEVGASCRIEAVPELPGLDAKDLRLFYRFKDGPWHGGEAGGSVQVTFPGDGTYTIELLGMDPQGGTTPHVSTLVVKSVAKPTESKPPAMRPPE